ncbi:MAG: hypothetical protein JW885_15450 [Deltaproteobacteria bacterium]|nr:hypothetical protein [Candidatus Zymogenaceae bacterium]
MDQKHIPDKKNIAAYALAGLSLFFHFKLSFSNVNSIIVLIALPLFFFSTLGSLRARLALIGFLMFLWVNSFILLKDYFSYLVYGFHSVTYYTTILITISAVIFLFVSTDIEETASRFSENTPVMLTAMLFILIFLWKLMQLITLPMLSYGELLVDLDVEGLFPVKYPFLDSVLVVLSVFISHTLMRKKAIGYILAPSVLIMITLINLYHVFSQVFISGMYKASNIYGVLLYYIFPLVATVLVIFFYFQPGRVLCEYFRVNIENKQKSNERDS